MPSCEPSIFFSGVERVVEVSVEGVGTLSNPVVNDY
jgi:hypothetical protein